MSNVESRSKGGSNSNGTSFTVALPSGVQPGNLLLVVAVFDADPDTDVSPVATASSGWTKGGQLNQTAHNVTSAWFYKFAEGSDTLTISTSTSETCQWVAYRISGAGAPTATGAQGSSANSAPAAHTAGSSTDSKWLWICSRGGDREVIASQIPSGGFSNLQTQQGSGTSSVSLQAVEKSNSAVQTLTPGPWTSDTEQWVTWTIGIPSGTTGGTVDGTFGKQTDGAASSSSSANRVFVSRFAPGNAGVLKTGHCRLSLTGPDTVPVRFVVYADSGGEPGALLATSGVTNLTETTETLKNFTFTGAGQISFASGTNYWLGVAWEDPGTESVVISRDATADMRREQSWTPSTLPNPFGTALASNTGPIDAYVTYVVGGQGGGSGVSPYQVGPMLNIGPLDGQNHFNIGIGYESGHKDHYQEVIAAPSQATLNEWAKYFYRDGDWVKFATPLDGKRTSANTQYPRVELRECLQQGGSSKASWNASSGTHYIKARERIDKLAPNKPGICVQQIHDASDDVAMVKTMPASGRIELRAYRSDTVIAVLDSNYIVGREFDLEHRVVNGILTVYYNGVARATASLTGSGMYFKIGSYAQSNSSIDAVSSGPVTLSIKKDTLECWHTGYPPPAIPNYDPEEPPPDPVDPEDPDPGDPDPGDPGGDTGDPEPEPDGPVNNTPQVLEPKTWYLGPAGDLKTLTAIDVGARPQHIRYGGVHQGLSGARTQDYTGSKAEYDLSWRYLDQAEFLWLEQMHTNHLPGPYRLIDPLKKNRLSAQASRHEINFGQTSASITGGRYVKVLDWPAAVPVPGKSISLSGWNSSANTVRYDAGRKITVLNLEQVTASVYVRALEAHTGSIAIEFYDRSHNLISVATSSAIEFNVTWQRHSLTATAPLRAALAVFRVTLGSDNTFVRLAAPQFENGSAATAWEPGGASPQVVIQELPTESPRFPLRDVSAKLLEN